MRLVEDERPHAHDLSSATSTRIVAGWCSSRSSVPPSSSPVVEWAVTVGRSDGSPLRNAISVVAKPCRNEYMSRRCLPNGTSSSAVP